MSKPKTSLSMSGFKNNTDRHIVTRGMIKTLKFINSRQYAKPEVMKYADLQSSNDNSLYSIALERGYIRMSKPGACIELTNCGRVVMNSRN